MYTHPNVQAAFYVLYHNKCNSELQLMALGVCCVINRWELNVYHGDFVPL